MITLPDISKISKLQTASDFHSCVGDNQCPAAISFPDCLSVIVEDLNLQKIYKNEDKNMLELLTIAL